MDICKVNPLKRQVAVQRRIGIFVKNIKDAIRLKKKFNLRFQAARFRDTHNEEQSFESSLVQPLHPRLSAVALTGRVGGHAKPLL